MQGFQLTFFTQEGRMHGKLSIAEWLTREARALGAGGVTVNAAQGGCGRDGKYHSAGFFELAERPVEITTALSSDNASKLFARIQEEGMKIFYVKIPIEFGFTGGE